MYESLCENVRTGWACLQVKLGLVVLITHVDPWIETPRKTNQNNLSYTSMGGEEKMDDLIKKTKQKPFSADINIIISTHPFSSSCSVQTCGEAEPIWATVGCETAWTELCQSVVGLTQRDSITLIAFHQGKISHHHFADFNLLSLSHLSTRAINLSVRLCVFSLQNFCSRAALEALGSCLNNKYSEGYPGKR